MTDREFLFEYRYGGAEWGIAIHAANPTEARDKIKAVGLARYKGEVQSRISVPGGAAWSWFKSLWQGERE